MSHEPMSGQMPNRAVQLVLVLPMLLYRVGLANQMAQRNIMLLHTVGRRTGRRRVSGLNYVVDGNTVYAAAGPGTRAGWYQNALANAMVELQIGERRVGAHVRAVTDDLELVKVATLISRLEGGGAPKPVQALMSRLGLDLEGERQGMLANPANLTALAFELAQPIESVPPTRTALPRSVFFAALGLAALIFATRRKRGRHH